MAPKRPVEASHAIFYGPGRPCGDWRECHYCYPDRTKSCFCNSLYCEECYPDTPPDDDPLSSIDTSAIMQMMSSMSSIQWPDLSGPMKTLTAALEKANTKVVTEEHFVQARRALLEAALEVVVAEAVGSPDGAYRGLTEAAREFVVTVHDYEEGQKGDG